MKIIYADVCRDSEEEPVVVLLTPQDRFNIAHMDAPPAQAYCGYPDDLDEDTIGRYLRVLIRDYGYQPDDLKPAINPYREENQREAGVHPDLIEPQEEAPAGKRMIGYGEGPTIIPLEGKPYVEEVTEDLQDVVRDLIGDVGGCADASEERAEEAPQAVEDPDKPGFQPCGCPVGEVCGFPKPVGILPDMDVTAIISLNIPGKHPEIIQVAMDTNKWQEKLALNRIEAKEAREGPCPDFFHVFEQTTPFRDGPVYYLFHCTICDLMVYRTAGPENRGLWFVSSDTVYKEAFTQENRCHVKEVTRGGGCSALLDHPRPGKE